LPFVIIIVAFVSLVNNFLTLSVDAFSKTRKQGKFEHKFAEKVINAVSSMYSRGMISHSFVILKGVLSNGKS